MNKIFHSFLSRGRRLFIRRQTNILSAAVVLMMMILASGILGLLRDRLLAGFFFNKEIAWQLDIYFASFRLPDMLFQVLVLSTLSAAFIPIYSDYLSESKRAAYEFASSILNIGLLIFLIATAVVFIFAKPLSYMITHTLTLEQLDLMVRLTRLILIAQFFFFLSNFLTGMLQSHQRFLLPALSAVLYNAGIILGIVFLTPFFGIYGPVWGVIIGAFVHFLIQYPAIKSLGFNYRFSFAWNHPGVRKAAKLMLPRTLAFAINQIQPNMVVFLATALTAGSFTIFTFGSHLSALPVSLFGLTIGQAALPTLAREAKKNVNNFIELFLSSLLQILYLSLPVSIILLVLRVPLVRLAFGTKNFPWEATLTTAKVVGVFSLFLAAKSVSQLVIRAFYAFQDTITPLILSGVYVLITVGLSFWLVFGLKSGVIGIVLAEGFGELVFAFLLFFFLEKKVGGFLNKNFLVPVTKIVFATIFTALALWLPMRILDSYVLDTTRTINLIILTIITLTVGLGTYILFSVMLKISQLKSFLLVLRRFGQWRQILSESQEVLDASQVSSVSPETE